MSKYLRMLGQGIKFSLYLGTATLTGSALYLQYINAQLGGIEIDRQAMTKYYSQHSKQFKVSESEARNMYYWLLIDISIMRVLTYKAYSNSCYKINRRIVDQNLKNYEDRNIIKEIQAVNAKPNRAKQRKIFNDIIAIRKANFENIEKYEFIVKQLRKQQKLMDTRNIMGFEGERREKVETVHKFLCKFGEIFNNPEIKRYNEQVPGLEEMLPGDVVHKILVI